MAFPQNVRTEALVRSRRHCCVCQEFAGRATDVHHIIQEADGGPNTLDNAIVLCLRCHSEAGHYNPRHPIGNKYSPEELKRHRDEWWRLLADNPAVSLPKSPIRVFPTEGRLVGTDASPVSILDIKVHNSSDTPFFGVVLRIEVVTPGVSHKAVKLEGGGEKATKGTPFSPDLSAGGMRGETPVKYIQFYCIDPKSTRTLTVRLEHADAPPPLRFEDFPPKKLNEIGRVDLRFAILDFSETPPERSGTTAGAGGMIGIRFPEGFTVDTIGIFKP